MNISIKLFTLLLVLSSPAFSVAEISGGWTPVSEIAAGYTLGAGIWLSAYLSAGGWDDYLASRRERTAVGILYPAACALGVYATGELAGDDSPNDGSVLVVTFTSSYLSYLIPSFIGNTAGTIIGLVLPPLMDTLFYNLAREGITYTAAVDTERYIPLVNLDWRF